MTGFIHSIETMGLVDGPGIRCVVFMQGCRLRCKYCHNPDTWEIGKDGTGTEYVAGALVERLLRYRDYFGEDGGVTFSGGEPLMQPEFLKEALKLCKEAGIHTCIDTAGVGPKDFLDFEEILEYTDLVLFDIKHVDALEYKDLTGQEMTQSSAFLDSCIKANKPLWLSHVMVPGITDNDKFVNKLQKYISGIPNVKNIRILPYHVLGSNKYKEMGIPERLRGVPPMDKERAGAYEDFLKQKLYKE